MQIKFVPTYTSHLMRYVFALEHCYKKNVIDLGCKDGYCSILLSYAAYKLDLVDIDKRFLDTARSLKYISPVEFHQIDLEKDFPEGKWQVAVAFEVIEHLENPEFFIKNIAEHLEDGGKLIFSVPHMVANIQHKVLFDEEKIKSLISKYFKIEEFYIQDKKIFSNKPMYKGLKCYLGTAIKIK